MALDLSAIAKQQQDAATQGMNDFATAVQASQNRESQLMTAQPAAQRQQSQATQSVQPLPDSGGAGGKGSGGGFGDIFKQIMGTGDAAAGATGDAAAAGGSSGFMDILTSLLGG